MEKLLEKAKKEKLSYADFFRILAVCLHPDRSVSIGFYDILETMRDFADEIARAPHNLLLMRKRANELVRNGYKPFLVDCFGLPEVYEVYKKVSEKCGVLAVSVEPYINTSALTCEFERAYKSPTMLDLAKMLGASLHRSTDKALHEEMGEPMKLDKLLGLAELKLKRVAEGLADDAMRARKAFIISDHGYDFYFRPPDEYYLGHGHESKLAKIAPLIIVEHKPCD